MQYTKLGFNWLFEVSYPASNFVTANNKEVVNPERFVHVTIKPRKDKCNSKQQEYSILF